MNRMISLRVVLVSVLACALFLYAEADECLPSEFKCNNQKCITHHWICDGRNQCGDYSDEQVCDPTMCHPAPYKCLNGKCIPRTWVCDGVDSCGDNSDEQLCDPFQCDPVAFPCLNGKCIPRWFFCQDNDHCGDNSDKRYCNKTTQEVCPHGWSECPNKRRCIPSHWVCDGFPDCSGESEEENCDNYEAKTNLKLWLLRKRKSGFRTDRWGSQVHRIAVALHLADNSTFGSGNCTGEEIRYELAMHLLYLLPRNKMKSQELALYIHALLVACLDPRDFYGEDLVRELRSRVDVAENHTSPFLTLVLCNAGGTMTAKDVERVTAAYNSQHRPFWIDSQALSSMALACIASRSDGLVDESTLTDMLGQLKKHQFRNGTVDNFKTTALVTQALFIHNSFAKDYDLKSAIKVLVDGFKGSESLLNAYYALPVLYQKSLLNVSSSHCGNQPVKEEEDLQKALDFNKETITVQFSVWMEDEINLSRTWRLRMLVNSTIYDAIETVDKIDKRVKVEYNVVDGKPYVTSLSGKEDDPDIGTFWFIYLKDLNSDEHPEIMEQSPVDINLTSNQEIILWYKRGPWYSERLIRKPVSSS